jgi:hypothetical protein
MMPSPLTRALSWKREALMQNEILEGLGRDPSTERDIAFDAFCEARKEYRSIIQDEWDLRAMSRGYVPARVEDVREVEVA